MANAKEIRTQITSINKTRKITRAMEMVAASKMRKAQNRMERSKPYAVRMRQVIGHLAKANPEYHHKYTIKREFKRVGFIIVATDRGLCGGLNINMLKTALQKMSEYNEQGLEIDLCLIGSKAEGFFKRTGGNVIAQTTHLGDKPSVTDLIGIVKVMLDAYDNETLDALYIVSNEFINTMTQQPFIEQLLPLEPDTDQALEHYWDYIYEPDARVLLEGLLGRYIESQVYQAVIENIACEQAARMIAMKSASDNAGELMDDLRLAYNKARQAAITQELSEIVSGAAAVE